MVFLASKKFFIALTSECKTFILFLKYEIRLKFNLKIKRLGSFGGTALILLNIF